MHRQTESPSLTMAGDSPRAPDFATACEHSIGDGARAEVLLLRAGTSAYGGTHVDVSDAPRLNFGSCSYLALEVREELRAGAIEAVRKFGTQFPFAKPQLECNLYGDLEAALEQMTGGKPVIASSATLAHLAALPALFRAGDAVIVDRLAHASIHMAMTLVKQAPFEMLPHNRMDLLAERIEELSRSHDRVWYVLDGVYSMSGAFARVDTLAELLARFPKLHLYSDDAHCTSWLGLRGRGLVLDRLPDRSRVVVTLSLNKAFSAGGGVLIAPTEELRTRILYAGAPLLFSGPLQPAQLGAAVASARLHLTPEFAELQATLARRIHETHALARAYGVHLATTDPTPIMFVPCGAEDGMFALFHAMLAHGFYIAPAVFPAVARGRAGLRLTVSLHNALEDTERLFVCLAREIQAIPSVAAHQRAVR